MKLNLKALQKFSIRTKLMLVSLVPIIVVLGLAGLAFVTYDLVAFQNTLARDLTINARLIGRTSRAAVRFQDSESAERILQALEAKPEILGAGIYNSDGEIMAAYVRAGTPLELPSSPEAPGHRFEPNRLLVFEPVMLAQRQIGAVFLLSDLGQLHQRMQLYALSAGAGFFGCFLVAYALSSRLQRIISQPILDLAAVAWTVSERKDFSVRAPLQTNDEIGVLTGAFNQMLAQIESQNSTLRENEERTRFAMRASQVGTWEWHIATDRITWSDAVAPLFGLRPGQFGTTYAEFLGRVHSSDRANIEQQVNEAIHKRKVYDVEFRTLWPDGSLHWLAARAQLFSEPFPDQRMLGVVIDITAKKGAEEALRRAHDNLEIRVRERTEELARAKTELEERVVERTSQLEAFSYSIAHDLRAPLRAIAGFSRILEDYVQSLPEEGALYLRRITENSEHMARLIDELLQFARLGSKPVTKQPVDVYELVHQLLADSKTELLGHPVQVIVRDLPACHADPTLLRQVFANLLSNALKFSRTRLRSEIEIGCTRNEGQAVYYVKDNGVGFDMKYVGKIFGVFERLHKREEFEGTGVGLAIVQRIILRHGGMIWADAKLDGGATFFFTVEPSSDSTRSPHPHERNPHNEPPPLVRL